ncbi:MAG: phosphoribosylanthranilate isomerase [Desulfovibrionaceae bacterium]|jgi:phosphoribosylanthranilate isomerase|nr:phosphoribosylanthranilate isomerase [Desulfovibrionaceae bacterium]
MTGNNDILVKVCGITSQRDADICLEQGVDLIGFIFHPDSPRSMTPAAVKAIHTGDLMRVGVFVNQTREEVVRILREADLHLAQLHGDQDESFCHYVGKRRVMRAFWPERYSSLNEFLDDAGRYASCARFFLFDSGAGGGGHGKRISCSCTVGDQGQKTWFLAGGLGPDTLADALEDCRPCGVDLNSGVESAPGVKDRDKLAACMKIINSGRYF